MKESPLLDVFMHASFFLVIAAIIVPLLKRFKVPPVLSYLLAGIIFGPQALGELTDQWPVLEYVTLQNSENLDLLSELGIVFLLFVIGLEITPRKLWQMKGLVFGLGASQVLITSAVIGTIAYLWGNSLQASILLGLGLSLSSTAIITQWLHENKLFNTKPGQTSFSILLFQDLAVIPILLLITIFTANMEGEIYSYITSLLINMTIAVATIVLIGKYFVRPIFSFSNKYGGSEVFVALSLLVIVVSASIAGAVGLSLALGAFIGGLLLAETQYSHEISSLVVPFKSMLLGIFFMAFGMTIDVDFFFDKTLLLLMSVVGLLTIKAVLIYSLCRLWRVSNGVAAQSAVILPQAGEFGLLVVGSSITFGLLDNDVGQFMFLTIGLTMMLTPIMALFSAKVGDYFTAREARKKKADLMQEPPEHIAGHIVVLGYGRMGQTVTKILKNVGIKTISFDSNIDRLKEGRDKDDDVYYGDFTKKATLISAQIENADAIVVTVDDPKITKRVVDQLQKISKSVPLMLRAHKQSDLDRVDKKNNIYIVPEYLSASLVLAEKVLERCGYTEDEAHSIVKNQQEA